MTVGDDVGPEGVDLILVVGLKAQLREGRAELGDVNGRPLGQELEPEALLLGKVVDRRAVGEDHRGVYRQLLPLHLDHEVDVGPSGGDAEQPALGQKPVNGGAVFRGDGPLAVVECIVIVRGQQNAGKLSHRLLLSVVTRGICFKSFYFILGGRILSRRLENSPAAGRIR